MEQIEQEQQEAPALPGYVVDTPAGRLFWQPNYDNYEQGAAWADEMLSHIVATGFVPLLAWTIMSMPRGDDIGPTELGFIDRLAVICSASRSAVPA